MASGPFSILLMALLAVAAGSDRAAAQNPDTMRTTLDSVFTAEQAAAGRQLYMQKCAHCHTLDWYTGEVVRAWEGGTVYGLYDVISSSMPEDNPSSLKSSEYTAILAYILELNGLPPGAEPLPVGRSRLNAIRFAFPKEPSR